VAICDALQAIGAAIVNKALSAVRFHFRLFIIEDPSCPPDSAKIMQIADFRTVHQSEALVGAVALLIEPLGVGNKTRIKFEIATCVAAKEVK